MKINQFGDTALDFLVTRLNNDHDKLYELINDGQPTKRDYARYEMVCEFLEMVEEAQADFADSLLDPMLDPQLG